jgi:hypothetical protein
LLEKAQGRHTGDPVRGAEAGSVCGEAGLDEQGMVSVHHAARRPGGARRVDDGRRRLLGDGLADIIVLADQIKSLDWRARQVVLTDRVPDPELGEVIGIVLHSSVKEALNRKWR